MAKNKNFINSQKLLYQKIADTVPQIYASVALALWNTLGGSDVEKQEAIESIFAESQEIWQKCADNNEDMIQMCEEVTGFDVRRTTN